MENTWLALNNESRVDVLADERSIPDCPAGRINAWEAVGPVAHPEHYLFIASEGGRITSGEWKLILSARSTPAVVPKEPPMSKPDPTFPLTRANQRLNYSSTGLLKTSSAPTYPCFAFRRLIASGSINRQTTHDDHDDATCMDVPRQSFIADFPEGR